MSNTVRPLASQQNEKCSAVTQGNEIVSEKTRQFCLSLIDPLSLFNPHRDSHEIVCLMPHSQEFFLSQIEFRQPHLSDQSLLSLVIYIW
jgi:hypothetical protein